MSSIYAIPSTDNLSDTASGPDIHSSSEEYAKRFAGKVGEWMLRIQSNLALSNIGPNDSVLDVGGGHAQLAKPLCELKSTGKWRGSLVVTGSESSCEERLKRLLPKESYKFSLGLTTLPFPDQSFDTVLSVRMISHIDDWRLFIKELCRVSRLSIIIDYPRRSSFNLLTPLLFRVKRRIERNTRSYTLFGDSEVVQEFNRYGFVLKAERAQFALPMVLHRLFNNVTFSSISEGVCRRLGLTDFMGSPVIVHMVRR